MNLISEYNPFNRVSDCFGVKKPTLSPMTLLGVGCWALSLYLNTGVAVAMQVTSTGPQTIQKAQGDKIQLNCAYLAGPSDTGDLDIEWSMISPDMTQKDQLILSYTGEKKYAHGSPALTDGLDFTAGDPTLGDASISISSLAFSHAGTYQCKVKKAPGVDSLKISVAVLVRPSVPKCWAEGSEEIEGAVSLHCKSSLGSTPLNYIWTKQGGGGLHPTATQNPVTGELIIRNHSESSAGDYLCEVRNPVGIQRCRYTLKCDKGHSRAGLVVGSVVGSLLLLLLLLLFIWFLICLWDRGCREKEAANDIREDVAAPVSRPVSRSCSAQPGGAYSSVRTSQRRALSEHSSTDDRKPPLYSSPRWPPLAYESDYSVPV